MLDERKTAILSAVVHEYIATAQPVGSTHIAGAPGVNVSSATVRNDMAVLEQEGYLVQPHTSAGRVPTDKGYRFFVDHLTAPGRLDDIAAQQVGEFFMTAHGRLEEMLHSTSNLLSSLTNYASVVVGPKSEAVAVRSVQLVGVHSNLATVVVVLSNGERRERDAARSTTTSATTSSPLSSAHLDRRSPDRSLSAGARPSADRRPGRRPVCAAEALPRFAP